MFENSPVGCDSDLFYQYLISERACILWHLCALVSILESDFGIHFWSLTFSTNFYWLSLISSKAKSWLSKNPFPLATFNSLKNQSLTFPNQFWLTASSLSQKQKLVTPPSPLQYVLWGAAVVPLLIIITLKISTPFILVITFSTFILTVGKLNS